MRKSDLVNIIAKREGLSKAAAERVVHTFLAAIVDGLSRGERVSISGFGTFTVRKKKARDIKVPQATRVVHVPEHLRPAFTAGEGFKRAVKGLEDVGV